MMVCRLRASAGYLAGLLKLILLGLLFITRSEIGHGNRPRLFYTCDSVSEIARSESRTQRFRTCKAVLLSRGVRTWKGKAENYTKGSAIPYRLQNSILPTLLC